MVKIDFSKAPIAMRAIGLLSDVKIKACNGVLSIYSSDDSKIRMIISTYLSENKEKDVIVA